MEEHLIIACPTLTSWAITSVRAETEQERERLAREVLHEFLIEGYLELPGQYKSLALSKSKADPRNEFLLSELFKRAVKMDDDGEQYVIYIGTSYIELQVPEPKEIRGDQGPMKVVVSRLVEEVRNILKEYPH